MINKIRTKNKMKAFFENNHKISDFISIKFSVYVLIVSSILSTIFSFFS